MATDGQDNPPANALREHATRLAQEVINQAKTVDEVGERTARIIVEAVETYARKTEEVLALCEHNAAQVRALTAQLEPLAGRINVDAIEREINAPPSLPRVGRMPEPRR